MAIQFEWDDAKASKNLQKHRISFDQVRALFTSNADYLEIFDVDHSLDEDRLICIGPIAAGIVLVVVTEVEEGLIRIISARRATTRECTLYADFLRERQR